MDDLDPDKMISEILEIFEIPKALPFEDFQIFYASLVKAMNDYGEQQYELAAILSSEN